MFDKLKAKGGSALNSLAVKRSKSPAPPAERSTDENEAPPAYTLSDPITPSQAAELTTAFTRLTFSDRPEPFPTTSHTLAHLKLLYTFHNLKLEIGYTNGLFGLWDNRCEKVEEAKKNDALIALREKRWAVYLARAVERFEDWWLKALCAREQALRMTCQDMIRGRGNFVGFVEDGKVQVWDSSNLPPLDVLMVWHAFMLNPRNYLEDCARFGLKDLWATGLPWGVINAAIDTSFNYTVPLNGQLQFTAATGHEWENVEDPLTKQLQCPRCPQVVEVPWTTVDAQGRGPQENLELDGTGYGDKSFSAKCSRCETTINHDLLRVAKFIRDTEDLIKNDYPFGGTILSYLGKLEVPRSGLVELNPFHFPNRLIKNELRSQVLELMNFDPQLPNPTVDDVKMLVETAISDKTLVKRVNGRGPMSTKGLGEQEKRAIRRMMARYWDNPSIFALELGGAVLRQGTFVEKMRSLDWLHSPSAEQTMERLLTKYTNFIHLMSLFREKLLVPTLDVDLGWHTAQLSPKQYYNYTNSKCRQFVDHDDKVAEDVLSDAFEWTCENYEKMFKKTYSECTCWYCEAIRAKYAGQKFTRTKAEKIADEFYDSGAAKLCPPNNSAHISAHNAVQIKDTGVQQQILERMRQKQRYELDKAYEKACKQADAKGRKRPSKEEVYDGAFGKGYLMYGPFLAVPFIMGGTYYMGTAYASNIGTGMYGACAQGTASAAGACTATGACAGAGGACAAGGACGGSGGGCGGGGGGCGGGGGM